MNVYDFRKECDECFKNDADINLLLLNHTGHVYISYRDKLEIINRIAMTSTHKVVDKKNEIFSRNRLIEQMLYDLHLVNLYTDIDIDFENEIFLQYDLLLKDDILNKIKNKCIPSYEKIQFREMLDAKIADIYDNENNLVAFLSDKLTTLKMIGNGFEDVLRDLVNENKLQELSEG